MADRQAGAVAIGGRAILIEGAPGSGKSSLALALIDRGARLIGDDSILVDVRGDRLFACPHPHTTGLIEVRNLGLVRMEPLASAPVCLVIRLDRAAPRYIERAEEITIEGVALPGLAIWPDGANPALKAELALRKFGLSLG